jgi:predicted N-acyltransferase
MKPSSPTGTPGPPTLPLRRGGAIRQTAVSGVTRVSSCSIQVHRTIHEVPAAEWDSLLGPGDLQATHRFIRTCEEAAVEGARYRHLMVYQDGALAAVASLCLMRVRLDLLSTGRVRRAIHCMRGWRPGFLELPVVFCGLPVSFGQSCLRIHPNADVAAVLEVVHTAADAFAGEEGAAAICFKEFPPPEAGDLQILVARGYLPLASLPSCRMALPWSSFEEYVASLRSGYRRQVLASLRTREQLGISFRTLRDFREECPRIFALYEQVIDRAEVRLERLNLAFFERLGANLPGESSALLVERKGELLASAILLRSGGRVTFLLAGIDYARQRENQSYVHLVTEVLAQAIRSGAGVLEMGQTSYALKQRLGADPSPRRIFFRHRRPGMHRLVRLASGRLFPQLELPTRQVFREAAAGSRATPGSALGTDDHASTRPTGA